MSCDIQNACLSDLRREKTCCRPSSKFDSEAGKIMIIEMTSHRLKSSSAVFRSMFNKIISCM